MVVSQILFYIFHFLFVQNLGDDEIIYSKVINDFIRDDVIAIIDSTSIGNPRYFEVTRFEYFKKSLEGLEDETLQNFVSNELSTSKKIVIINKVDFDRIFRNGNGWSEFYETYGKTQGILTLSNIGYNSDKTQAIIYYGNQSTYRSGAGYLVLFSKINGNWVKSSSVMLWIS